MFPTRSNKLIPEQLRSLMLDDSDFKSFFPQEIKCDLTGLRFAWQGHLKLPFLDE